MEFKKLFFLRFLIINIILYSESVDSISKESFNVRRTSNSQKFNEVIPNIYLYPDLKFAGSDPDKIGRKFGLKLEHEDILY